MTQGSPETLPIGVLDSGVGGLSVLRALVQHLPGEKWVYFADQAHVPYGEKPEAALRAYARRIVAFLMARGIKALVVACNTLSAAALDDLRRAFPHLPIVGMEPAVKPAARGTRRGVVGVLATQATLASRRYRHLKARFGQGVRFLEDPCVGLVEHIEAGRLDGPEVETLLREVLRPMQQAGADTVVLGCTHYPFVEPVLRRLLGPEVRLVDPAHAVARQTRRVLEGRGMLHHRGRGGVLTYYTTGSARTFARQIRRLVPALEAPVHPLPFFWENQAEEHFRAIKR